MRGRRGSRSRVRVPIPRWLIHTGHSAAAAALPGASPASEFNKAPPGSWNPFRGEGTAKPTAEKYCSEAKTYQGSPFCQNAPCEFTDITAAVPCCGIIHSSPSELTACHCPLQVTEERSPHFLKQRAVAAGEFAPLSPVWQCQLTPLPSAPQSLPGHGFGSLCSSHFALQQFRTQPQ